MIPSKKIVWYEGMPLLPQHFQYQEKHFNYLLKKMCNYSDFQSWGIIDLEWEEEALLNGTLKIKQLTAIMPKGDYVELNNHNEYINSIDILAEHNSLSVFLTPEKSQDERFETCFDSSDKFSHRIEQVSLFDTHFQKNLFLDEPTDIQVSSRKFNLTISEKSPTYNSIKLAEIIKTSNLDRVIFSELFIPAFFNIMKDKNLVEKCQNILSLTDLKISSLRSTINMNQLDNYTYELQILNIVTSFRTDIKNIIQVKYARAWELYQLLSKTLAQISNYHPQKIPENKFPKFSFTHLAECYHFYLDMLSTYLSLNETRGASRFQLNKISYGKWASFLPEVKLNKKNRVILILSNETNDISFRSDEIIIAKKSQIEELICRSLPGYNIKRLLEPPKGIPLKNNSVYFDIFIENEAASDYNKEFEICVYVRQEITDTHLEIWIIDSN